MNLKVGKLVGNMFKLTVALEEKQRGYTRLLVKRLGLKTKDELIAKLIEEKTASLYDYA